MYDRVSGRGMEAGMGGEMVNGGVAGDSPSPTHSAEGPKTTPQRKMSWRLGILNRVVTPVRPHDGDRISGKRYRYISVVMTINIFDIFLYLIFSCKNLFINE